MAGKIICTPPQWNFNLTPLLPFVRKWHGRRPDNRGGWNKIPDGFATSITAPKAQKKARQKDLSQDMCSNQPTIVGQSVTVIAAEKVTWLRQQKRGNLGIKLASRAKASQNSTRFCGDSCQVLGKTHSKILEKIT